ncbi:MAG: transporter substrate-binding domain-containing protein [Candidatus Krumholzibacteriia bacterium]
MPGSLPHPSRCRCIAVLAGVCVAVWAAAAGAVEASRDATYPAPAPAPTGTVVVGGGDGYEPYHYLDDGRPTGFDIELLQAVAAAMGLVLDIRLGPWADVRDGLAAGTVDVHAGMSQSAGRNRRYMFSTPVLTQQSRIFVRAGNAAIGGAADLHGRRIAVQRDGVMADFVREQGYTDEPLLVESAADALRAVASGRADCCLISEFRGLHVLQQLGLDGVVRVGEPVMRTSYGFAVRQGRRDILLRLNMGLAIVEKSGEYDRIYAKWFGILDPGPGMWEYLRYAAWVIVPLLVVLALAFLWTWALRRQVARRTAELAQARDQAEAASAAKSAFLTTMSHELRTPLNAVVGMCELLRTTDLDDPQREHLAVIDRAAATLQGGIGDVLVIADQERAGSALERGEFDLAALLAEAVATAEAAARVKGLELRVDLDPALPSRAVGDPGALGRVLRHLLDNAVKFTPAGRVELRVAGRPLGDGRLRLEGAVADTGIGVPPEAREGIFGTFTQMDSSSTRRYGGSGLGLAVCRSLLRRMEGDVAVADGPSGGSLFTFSAVVGPAAAPLAAVADPAPEPSSAGAARPILVVEDNPTNLRVVSLLLRKWGYGLAAAENGAAAVEAWRAGDFGAVLMDCQMPVMDGLEATRAIRALEDGRRRVPIIALTAGAFGSDRDLCLEAGMDDYLTKPVNAAQLRKALQMWLAVGDRVPV